MYYKKVCSLHRKGSDDSTNQSWEIARLHKINNQDINIRSQRVVLQLRKLDADFSPRSSGFNPMSLRIGSVNKRSGRCFSSTNAPQSRDGSVGIALGYGLDDRGSRVRFPAGAGNFSLYHQNGSGAHPASYSMGSGGSFPWGKAAGTWSWPLISI
jgi:hypothetical protein